MQSLGSRGELLFGVDEQPLRILAAVGINRYRFRDMYLFGTPSKSRWKHQHLGIRLRDGGVWGSVDVRKEL